MADFDAAQLFELEQRKLALEATKESNRQAEAQSAAELDAKRLQRENTARSPALVTSILTGIVAAGATMGAAFLSGWFSVSNTSEVNRGQVALEQQKFALGLLDEALSVEEDQVRADRLIFLADIGVFDERLNSVRIREIAQAELVRLKSGQQGKSLLPQSLGVSTEPVAFFFSEDNPNLEVFRSDRTVRTFRDYGLLENPEAVAILLANLHHETVGFRVTSENLNYSATALWRVFRRSFETREEADALARNPEAIANKVYAGRLGNIEPGDGWKYRGRGFVQITGRANYERFSGLIGVDLVSQPDLAANPIFALEIALAYLSTQKRSGKALVEWAIEGDDQMVRRGINGSVHGLDDIRALKDAYLAAFAAPEFADHPLVLALKGE